MAEAVTLLKKDHRQVESILAELESTTSRATKKRQELFALLKSELDLHEKVEEKIFYPELKNDKEGKPLILEAYEEHGVVDDLLAKLEETEVDDETWIAKITVLKECLAHHIKEEEGEIFPLAKEHLSAEKLKEMGQAIETMKAQA